MNIAVAVSGGVDSLCALLLLQEQGHEVFALHARFLPDYCLAGGFDALLGGVKKTGNDAGQNAGADAASNSTAGADANAKTSATPNTERDAASEKNAAADVYAAAMQKQEAMRSRLAETCNKLGIAFHCVDLRKEFEENVIVPFVAAYSKGQTPNPCVLCNAAMKFGYLVDAAQKLGADMLATGHYARLCHGGKMATEFSKNPSAAASAYNENSALSPTFPPALCRANDAQKDQSYFLALVPQTQLARALFPLATWQKSDVVAYLAQHGIAAPEAKESQEICFVPNDEYRVFLDNYQALSRSSAYTLPKFSLPPQGKIILHEHDGTETPFMQFGPHKGLWQYTEGQRRGLGLAWKEPLYVLEKRLAKNTLVVGPAAALHSAGCVCGQVNFLVPPAHWAEFAEENISEKSDCPAKTSTTLSEAPNTAPSLNFFVRTRYRQKAQPARVELLNTHTKNAAPSEGKMPTNATASENSKKSSATTWRLRIHFAESCTPPACGQLAVVYDGTGRVFGGGIIEEIF